MFWRKAPKTTFEAFGGHKLDVLPGLRRALRVRPVIRDESVPALAELIARHANGGRIEEAVARTGELLTKDELRALGLPAAPRMSREIHGMLTEAGRADPWRSLRFVVGRAVGFAYGEHSRRGLLEPETMAAFPLYELVTGKDACAHALALTGRRATEGAPSLPFEDCDIDDCQCRIRSVSRKRS